MRPWSTRSWRIWCTGGPTPRLLAALLRRHADELFAGYDHHPEIDDHDMLREELRRCVQPLHDVNLQRVDRMTMATSSLEHPEAVLDSVARWTDRPAGVPA